MVFIPTPKRIQCLCVSPCQGRPGGLHQPEVVSVSLDIWLFNNLMSGYTESYSTQSWQNRFFWYIYMYRIILLAYICMYGIRTHALYCPSTYMDEKNVSVLLKPKLETWGTQRRINDIDQWRAIKRELILKRKYTGWEPLTQQSKLSLTRLPPINLVGREMHVAVPDVGLIQSLKARVEQRLAALVTNKIESILPSNRNTVFSCFWTWITTTRPPGSHVCQPSGKYSTMGYQALDSALKNTSRCLRYSVCNCPTGLGTF